MIELLTSEVGITIIGMVGVIIGFVIWGEKKKNDGYKEAKSESTSQALEEIIKVTQHNLLMKERDDAIRNEISGPWGDRDVIKLPTSGTDRKDS